jgi:Protein of unknown function (DUF3224)
MSDQIAATFEVKSWDETPIDEAEGAAKLTQAAVTKRYSGDIEGDSHTTWLMAYEPDDTATFVGLERITGTVAGHEGTLVLQHVGQFRDGSADATLSVLSGTGDLQGATGDGSFKADPSGSVSLNINFER